MKIILLGYGKMGHEVEQMALQCGHEIVAKIDNNEDWEKFKVTKSPSHQVTENFSNSEAVAIEFSTPATALENINPSYDLNIPVVCGTTAWYQHLNEVRERCLKENQALFYAPNFSIGMNIMFMLNRQLAKFSEKYDYKLYLTETHHIHKLDRPSGTAVKLAEDIIECNNHYNSWRCDEECIIHNAQCIIEDDVLPIESIRAGDVFGIHEVNATSDCDVINLSHEAFSRKGFAKGAVIAAEFLADKKGIFTMNDLLNN